MSKKMNVILILVLFVVLMTAAYVVYNMAGADSDGAGVRDEVAALTSQCMISRVMRLSCRISGADRWY